MRLLAVFTFLCSRLAFVCSNAGFNFGPVFKYDHGEYWGENYFDEALGIIVPHGKGTYVNDEKTMKFDGEWKHGELYEGTRYFEDGRNYTGTFRDSMLHGRGRMSYKNKTVIDGDFIHGRPCGNIIMTYSNGDIRSGSFNGTWMGRALFHEKGRSTPWTENWANGSYRAEVDIVKNVIDDYQAIKVEVVCKVHSQTATPEILKEGIKIRNALLQPSQMLDQEVATLIVTLNFSDDPFKTYTCKAVEGSKTVAKKSLVVRNPFFFMSHGDCGAQLASNVVRPRRSPISSSPRVSMGHEQLYPGQIPWQALLWSDTEVEGPNGREKLGGFCGGTIISPYHILTAAHCLQTEFTPLGRNLTADEIVVKLGYTSQPHDIHGDIYSVRRMYIHPEFEHTSNGAILQNDIALLSLKSRIKITMYVNPICLPEPKLIHTIGDEDKLTLSGFGLYLNKQTGLWEKPTFLQMTDDIRKLPMTDCLGYDHKKFDGHMCAGDGNTFDEANNFTPDSCNGDSGSPLAFQDPYTRRFKLVGLVSWGLKQCGTAKGSIYVNVSNYVDWVQKAKLLDVTDDFNENGEIPYDKMDNAIFHAMLEYLGKTRHAYLGGIL